MLHQKGSIKAFNELGMPLLWRSSHKKTGWFPGHPVFAPTSSLSWLVCALQGLEHTNDYVSSRHKRSPKAPSALKCVNQQTLIVWWQWRHSDLFGLLAAGCMAWPTPGLYGALVRWISSSRSVPRSLCLCGKVMLDRSAVIKITS